jgi:putative Holliday junction resolvase
LIILSVDLGAARTGVAVCDKGEAFAFPRGVIHERDLDRLVEALAARAAEEKAALIVVGLPRNMDGSEGFKAAECREAAALLARRTGLPVEMQDERCTTLSAHTALNYTDTRGKKRKDVVDAVAAVMILEDYLARRKNTAGRS